MLPVNANSFLKWMTLLYVVFCIQTASWAQKEKMVLTFSQDGKLLDGYKDRFQPNNKNYKVDSTKKKGWQIKRDTLRYETVINKKDTLKKVDSVFLKDTILIKENWVKEKGKIKKENSTQVEVLIDNTFFEKDEKVLSKIKEQVDNTLKNTTLLGAILGADTTEIHKLINNNWDSSDGKFAPKELGEFKKMIDDLKKGKAGDLINHPAMLPFKLFVGKRQIDSKWVKEDVATGKSTLVFDIPDNLFEQYSIESFRLVRSYPLKEATLDFMNKLLDSAKDTLPALLIYEKRIAGASAQLDEFIKELTEYLVLTDTCGNPAHPCPKGANVTARISVLTDSLTRHSKALEEELGKFPHDCKNPELPDGSILTCAPIKTWIARLVWLNGSTIRLNPFSFTLPSRLPTAEQEDKESARIRVAFWDKGISQLQARSEKTADIAKEGSGVRKELDTLLVARKAAADVLTKNPDSTNKAGADKNRIAMNALLTTGQTLYKGWLVPYQPHKNSAYKSEKIWLRNYYIENEAEPLRQKLHFTYPEDENVTLLVHNVPANTTISTQENKKDFLDSAEFTVRAGKVIGQAASLYSLVGGIVPAAAGVLRFLNENTTGNKISPQNGSIKILVQDASVSSAGADKKGKDSTLVSVLFPNGERKSFKLPGKITQEEEEKTKTLIKQILDTIRKEPELIVTVTAAEPATELCLSKYTLDYAKALKQIADAPHLIDQPLQPQEDTTAVYYTYRHKISTFEAPYRMDYKLSALSKNDTGGTVSRFIDSSYISVGKLYHVQLAAGLAYTFNAGTITTVDTSGAGFKIKRDDDKFSLMVGIRFYPKGLYNQKNPVCISKDGRWVNRLSVLLATGIPKPLQNFYVGGGYDIVPGFCLSGGVHFQQQNEYAIQNNTVTARHILYKTHVFASFTIDPTLLVTAVTSLLKK